MKAIVLSTLACASVASAGPYDALTASDPCRTLVRAPVVVLPDADGLRTGVTDDGTAAPPLAVISGVYGTGDQKGDHGGPGWCAEDVQVTVDGKPQALVYSAVWSIDLDANATNTLAAHWALPMSDADVKANAGTLPIAVLPDPDADRAPDASAIVTQATSTRKLAALGDVQLTVVSSAGDILLGAKAKKALARWNLDLAIDPHVASDEATQYGDSVAWVLADVTATPHKKKHAHGITYRAFYGLTRAEGGAWHVGLVHFAIVR